MEKEKYVCPICGKSFVSASSMANCILKDEKEAKEKEYSTKIQTLEDTIKALYDKLTATTDEFNEISKEKKYTPSLKSTLKTGRISIKNDSNELDYTELLDGILSLI